MRLSLSLQSLSLSVVVCVYLCILPGYMCVYWHVGLQNICITLCLPEKCFARFSAFYHICHFVMVTGADFMQNTSFTRTCLSTGQTEESLLLWQINTSICFDLAWVKHEPCLCFFFFIQYFIIIYWGDFWRGTSCFSLSIRFWLMRVSLGFMFMLKFIATLLLFFFFFGGEYCNFERKCLKRIENIVCWGIYFVRIFCVYIYS